MDIIKLAIPVIAEPLSCIINNSFTNGVVPDSLKIARVCPKFKCGNKTEFNNYRPISILLILADIDLSKALIRSTKVFYVTNYSIMGLGLSSKLKRKFGVPRVPY